MSTPQIFSPPASCFTSQYGLQSSTDSAAGTVYVTASVGCPQTFYEQSSLQYPQLPQCCGPFSNQVLELVASSQICPEGYGYVDVGSSAGATSAGCCPTEGGFTIDPNSLFGLIGACTITPPSVTATGTGYVTVTQTVAQTLEAQWNQQVLNILGTTPNLSAAPSAAATTGTPTHIVIPTSSGSGITVHPTSSTKTSAGIGARARVGGLAMIVLANFLWQVLLIKFIL